MNRLFFAACLAIALAVLDAALLSAQPAQLARWVPSTANALVSINLKTVLETPLARQKNWREKHEQAFVAGMISIPTDIDWFLMASQLDFEIMRPTWELNLIQSQRLPAMEILARRRDAKLEQLAGVPGFFEPSNDSYIVRLDEHTIADRSPANRQAVLRWIRQTRKQPAAHLSPFLTKILAENLGQSQIMLALDLEGVLSRFEIMQKLGELDALKDKAADREQLADLLAGIVGLRLAVDIRNAAYGRLTIEFTEDAAPLSKLAKPLTMEILAAQGAALEDMQHWNSRAVGNQILMEGPLSQQGLRRVLSVVATPRAPSAADSSAEPPPTAHPTLVAEASRRYFHSVHRLLVDLLGKNNEVESLYQVAFWLERYADNITNLSTYNVDQRLIEYGNQVAMLLREIAASARRAQARSDRRESNMYWAGRRRYAQYGAYGFYEKPIATRDRQEIQTDETARVWKDSQAISQRIFQLTADVRQRMNKKYAGGF